MNVWEALGVGLNVQLAREALSFEPSHSHKVLKNVLECSCKPTSRSSRVTEISLPTKKKRECSCPHLGGWHHLSPQRKGHTFFCGSPLLWKSSVTSPPITLPLSSSPAGSLAKVPCCLCKCHSLLTKLLDLVCVPCSTAKWEEAWGSCRGREEVCVQLAGRLLFTQLMGSSIYPSTAQTEAPRIEFSFWTMLSMLNPVNRLARQDYCGYFFISRVGFSFKFCIKTLQHGLYFASTEPLSKWTHRESSLVDPFSRSKEKICAVDQKAHWVNKFIYLWAKWVKCVGAPEPRCSGYDITVNSGLCKQAFAELW